LHPDDLCSPALSQWMATELPPLQVGGRIKLDGLDRLPGLAEEVLATARPTALAS